MAKTETGTAVQKTPEQKQQSALQMLEQKLAAAPSLKSALLMPIVEQRFIADYEASTQKKDGKARYAAEVLAYMEIVSESKDLADADRWQHFAAIAKVGRTGLSLRSGQDLYVYPGKNKTIKVEPTPSGRRKRMEAMDTIQRFPEAQLVMRGDEFEHDRLNNVITKHKSTKESKPLGINLDNIFASYQRIYWKNGIVEDIVVYHEDLLRAREKSTAKEAGLWQKFPGEASKKTATKRADRLYYKLPEGLMVLGNEEEEEETKDVTHTVDFTGPLNDTKLPENLDTDTGELKSGEEGKEPPPSKAFEV